MGCRAGQETKRRGLAARASTRRKKGLLIPIAPTALLPAAFTFVVTIRYSNVARSVPGATRTKKE